MRRTKSVLKFWHLLEGSNRNIHNDLLDVCGDQVVAYSTVRRWPQLFRERRETIEDEPWTGRPTSATDEVSVEFVSQFLGKDPCCSIEEISMYTEVSTGNIYRILKEDLGDRKVCARCAQYSILDPK
ncbi:hypothetical protein LOD99_10287 [Oopsacas minuta]|uniref:Mos1 transposase HTH domain-containing protein n=1 Tax=Oopsacas minuta TaxID=111878 RepID=A0AAV7KHB6_9METZ|nr:hypothetical protein LOD99_10287 [Oopsacas minuta]